MSASCHAVKLDGSLDEGKPIFGLTVLNDELYVGYRLQCNVDIAIYETDTYNLRRSLRVPGFRRFIDMTSCTRHRCIYIADDENRLVHRVEPGVDDRTNSWAVSDRPHGLSVTAASNVLVTC